MKDYVMASDSDYEGLCLRSETCKAGSMWRRGVNVGVYLSFCGEMAVRLCVGMFVFALVRVIMTDW